MKKYPIILFHSMFMLTFLAYAFLGVTIQNGILSYFILFCSYIFLNLFSQKNILIKPSILLDYLVINYIFWSLITVFQVYFFNNSFLVYIKGVTYCLFPISGYFLFSYTKYDLNIVKVNSYLKFILYTTIFALLIGFYFYFFTPPVYVGYVLKSYEGLINDEDSLFMARLLSYFGDPTVMGNISVISIPILIYLYRQNDIFLKSKLIRLIVFVVLFSGVILSFARSAWVACFIYVIYLLVIDNKHVLLRVLSTSFLIFIISFFSVFVNLNLDNLVMIELQKRIESLGSSFEERNSQIEYGFNIISNSPMGIGLGQAGHKSFSGDILKGVFDNNYLRVFAETGFFGFFSLLLIMFVSIYMCLKNTRHVEYKDLRKLLLIILLVFYFQAVGSNILDLHYSSFLFWSLLGILSWTYKHSEIPIKIAL